MKTPFQLLLPPLTTEELSALKADIEANGVRVPIEVDEDGNVLDGHHRLKIDKSAKRRIVRGLSEAEKVAHVYRSNLARRNLSPSQRTEVRKRLKATAKLLREEGRTQKQAAELLGVSRRTVDAWESAPNVKDDIRRTIDVRVKISPKESPKIAERIEAGESQEQVAADYGVSRQHISRIATKEKKSAAAKRSRFGPNGGPGNCCGGWN